MNNPLEYFALAGQSGIITGGAGALGRQFTRALIQMGANVAVADKSQAALDSFQLDLGAERPGKAIFVECDVSCESSVERLVRLTLEEFGEVNFLVNNAAATAPIDPRLTFKPLEDYDYSEWRRIMQVNLDGMFLVSKHVGSAMIAQKKGGVVVQTASVYGVMASDKRIYEGCSYNGYHFNNPAVYSASKAGVVGLTRWLAAEWAEHGIRVNSVAPGGVVSLENEQFVRQYSARVPMKRMANEDEITGTLIYLLSRASSYVTGQCLMVDGGLSAW